MKLEFPGAVPKIPVRDIAEAAAYYENNLGFTVDWGGRGTWACRSLKGKLQDVSGELRLSKGMRECRASSDLAEFEEQG